MPIRRANVGDGGVADAQGEVIDDAVDRGDEARAREPPLSGFQFCDRAGLRGAVHLRLGFRPRDAGLRDRQSLVLAPQFIVGLIERRARDVAIFRKVDDTALGDPRQGGGGSRARDQILRRLNGISVARQLRLGFCDLGFFLGDHETEGLGIDGRQVVAGVHRLVVGDVNGDDLAADLWRDGDEIGTHIGVVRIGGDAEDELVEQIGRRHRCDREQDASSSGHGRVSLGVHQPSELERRSSDGAQTIVREVAIQPEPAFAAGL